jgi:hypothetical protein
MGCEGEAARGILDAVRARLEAAVTVAGLPAFTVSFGLVESRDSDALPSLIDRADVALFQAKRDGRDRVVRHDLFGSPVDKPDDAGSPGADAPGRGRGDLGRAVVRADRTPA